MIEFKKVRKAFGEKVVLAELCFQIPKGQIVFVLGKSGTGKSVLLKNIVGLMRPDSGEIWVDGGRVDTLSEEDYGSVRRKCGMVFQQPALLDSLSVEQNVSFGLRRLMHLDEDQITERVRQCLQSVHLAGIEKKMPQEISYGMQKRVSLARTLALNPQVLLFDEPTTGLDPVTTKAISVLIRDLSRSMATTSMVVSHDMASAIEIADRILMLDQGAVVADGTPEELLGSSHPLVQEFLLEVRA